MIFSVLFGEGDYSEEWSAGDWALVWMAIFFGAYWL